MDSIIFLIPGVHVFPACVSVCDTFYIAANHGHEIHRICTEVKWGKAGGFFFLALSCVRLCVEHVEIHSDRLQARKAKAHEKQDEHMKKDQT